MALGDAARDGHGTGLAHCNGLAKHRPGVLRGTILIFRTCSWASPRELPRMGLLAEIALRKRRRRSNPARPISAREADCRTNWAPASPSRISSNVRICQTHTHNTNLRPPSKRQGISSGQREMADAKVKPQQVSSARKLSSGPRRRRKSVSRPLSLE